MHDRHSSLIVRTNRSAYAFMFGAAPTVLTSIATSPGRAEADRELAERMATALGAVPEESREVVRLRLFEDLTMGRSRRAPSLPGRGQEPGPGAAGLAAQEKNAQELMTKPTDANIGGLDRAAWEREAQLITVHELAHVPVRREVMARYDAGALPEANAEAFLGPLNEAAGVLAEMPLLHDQAATGGASRDSRQGARPDAPRQRLLHGRVAGPRVLFRELRHRARASEVLGGPCGDDLDLAAVRGDRRGTRSRQVLRRQGAA